MATNERCEKIKLNPVEAIPELFSDGCLGAKTLIKACQNAKYYKKAHGYLRDMQYIGQRFL